jgi:hypothetical protein
MATEMNVCSGCQYPRREGMIFVLTSLGMLCESCVSSSYEQLALARRRVDVMAWVRQSATLLFDVAEPKQPMWHSDGGSGQTPRTRLSAQRPRPSICAAKRTLRGRSRVLRDKGPGRASHRFADRSFVDLTGG